MQSFREVSRQFKGVTVGHQRYGVPQTIVDGTAMTAAFQMALDTHAQFFRDLSIVEVGDLSPDLPAGDFDLELIN